MGFDTRLTRNTNNNNSENVTQALLYRVSIPRWLIHLISSLQSITGLLHSLITHLSFTSPVFPHLPLSLLPRLRLQLHCFGLSSYTHSEDLFPTTNSFIRISAPLASTIYIRRTGFHWTLGPSAPSLFCFLTFFPSQYLCRPKQVVAQRHDFVFSKKNGFDLRT